MSNPRTAIKLGEISEVIIKQDLLCEACYLQTQQPGVGLGWLSGMTASKPFIPQFNCSSLFAHLLNVEQIFPLVFLCCFFWEVLSGLPGASHGGSSGLNSADAYGEA